VLGGDFDLPWLWWVALLARSARLQGCSIEAYPLSVRTEQSEWQATDWSGRWRIVRRDWAEATPQSRRLWVFSFGSGFGLPLACIVAILLVPSEQTALIIGFTVAFVGVFLLLSLRAVVLTLRKHRNPS
jgi:hypothetical protein